MGSGFRFTKGCCCPEMTELGKGAGFGREGDGEPSDGARDSRHMTRKA
jgi:hypothetical protein